MDTSSLEELLSLLDQDLPLSEIAQPLLLANALQFVMESDLQEDQKDLVHRICDRYWALCDHEAEQANGFDHSPDDQDSLTIFSVCIDSAGKLVSSDESFDTAIAVTAIGGAESPSLQGAAHQLALAVHQQRVLMARRLEDEWHTFEKETH